LDNVIIKLTIYIKANGAESGPPLGTTLGNIGVNTVKFCKEFNEFTKELPNYFMLRVSIVIAENKGFTFSTSLPSIGFLIYLLKKEETLKSKDGVTTTNSYIYSEDLLKLAKFKFPNYDIKKSSKIIKGSLLSANINVKL
jgi:large subunit ribosomal protein L11